jgi:AcrR family transcriptional regulator
MLSTSTSCGTVVAVTEQAARPYHHGNLRAVLLERAERTVADRGAQALSLRELAREVGVSHGAPRRHFADRQALLDALAEDGWDRLRDELQAAVEPATSPWEERLAAMASTYVRFATEHAALLELMFAGKHRPEAEALRAAADRAFAVALSLIAEGEASGAVQSGDPERLGKVLFATLQGLATMANRDLLDRDQLDELVTDSVARLLRGSRPV